MIKLLINDKEVPFEITKFPDGTSQVWKINHQSLPFDQGKVLWLFENEAEVFHVCQLAHLLSRSFSISPTLCVPYLPYGRQDKRIANDASFALRTFVEMVKPFFYNIETYDPHSEVITMIAEHYTAPDAFHKTVFNHDVACFPDKGAAHRYGTNFADRAPIVHCEKVRDQLTGNILGLSVMNHGIDIEGKTILIVDDICDAGGTFIAVAQELQKFNPLRIDLAVSHGLFSKGKQRIHDSGITNIYTTNSLLRNPDGFKVW
jgi:ribose-phosphate pyrophosphokinase